MDKIHNISLGGFAFSIDDVAFNILNRYLSDIRLSINNIEGAEEIISDVEFRMAELLRERLGGREVVSTSDVYYLIEIMGEPKDFYSEEFADESTTSNDAHSRSTYTTSQKSKKLFRDPDNKMIGGVCAGLGHYVGMDATWVRIITIAAMFIDPIFFSMGSMIFVGYFILWLVVPEAKTTSEKLQMRGEPVNVDSIRDFFGKSPENLKSKLNDVGSDARRVASDSSTVLGDILRVIFKIIGVLFLVILVIIALALLLAFVALIFGAGSAIYGVGIATFSLDEYLPYIFNNQWEKIFLYTSLFFVLVIPAVALILLVLRIISKRYSVPRYVGFGLPLLWLVGVFGLIATVGLTFSNFSKTASEIKTVNIPTRANTIIMQIDDDDDSFDSEDLLSKQPGFLTFPNTDDIKVKKSTTGINYLELKYTAKGKNKDAARDNIKTIQYNYNIADSLVHLGRYTYLKEGHQWRNQEVEPILYLTDSTQVIFRNFDDGEAFINGNRKWFDANSENIYIFDKDSFKCINCIDETIEIKEVDTISIKDSEHNSVDIQANEDSIHIKIK